MFLKQLLHLINKIKYGSLEWSACKITTFPRIHGLIQEADTSCIQFLKDPSFWTGNTKLKDFQFRTAQGLKDKKNAQWALISVNHISDRAIFDHVVVDAVDWHTLLGLYNVATLLRPSHMNTVHFTMSLICTVRCHIYASYSTSMKCQRHKY